MRKKLNYILILTLISTSIYCKNEKKKNESNSKTELEYMISRDTDSYGKQQDKEKPYVIAVDIKSFFLNDFNLSILFDEKVLIDNLGKPDKFEKRNDYIDETGFPDYDVEYGKNTIWASYGFVSNVYIEDSQMSINGIKLGDSRNKVEKIFNVKTQEKNYIQLVNDSDQSAFIKFDKNNIVTELEYGSLVL